nr:DUF4249 family protein [Bacteroidales bacterium]
KVTLNDGDNSEVLILRKDSRYFPPYYYAGNTIIGETGKTYTLTAEYGGKSIIAHTSIPEAVGIDTSYFELINGDDSLGNVVIQFTDPPDKKNYYRIFTNRLGSDNRFISSLVIAIDYHFLSGKKISFELYRAPESFLSAEGNDFFSMGDTIVMKLCTMDEETFKFWNTYQDEVINATNPFASSMIDLESNIEGDGLGVWGGYGVGLDTIVAK